MERHERVAKAIAASGLKKGEIATACGVANSAVTQWITGESKGFRPENLYALAKATGYNAQWLAIGNGPEMATPLSSGKEIGNPQNLAHRYPVISWASAGSWDKASMPPYPEGFSDHDEVSDYDAKGRGFWLEVKGDSMTSPIGVSVPEGVMILVDTEADAISGKLVVAKLAANSEATFKKLVEEGGIRYLKPLNPDYRTVECDDSCRIIGVAVRMARKL